MDPRQECLELNHSELHQRHLDATNSTAGYSIYGKATLSPVSCGLPLEGPRPGSQERDDTPPPTRAVLGGDPWPRSERGLLAPPSVSYSSILRTWTTSLLLGKSPVGIRGLPSLTLDLSKYHSCTWQIEAKRSDQSPLCGGILGISLISSLELLLKCVVCPGTSQVLGLAKFRRPTSPSSCSLSPPPPLKTGVVSWHRCGLHEPL